MSSDTLSALVQITNTCATVGAACYLGNRLFKYLEARLPYKGAELVPGSGITKVIVEPEAN